MLQALEVTNFRCIASAQLEFDHRCTLLTGPNGAGKTSVLEAIHVLSCGRSFRSSHLENLIREGKSHFSIFGRLAGASVAQVGVEVSLSRKRVRINQDDVSSFAPIAELLPVAVIEPGAHKLLEDGPSRRRRFIDWGVFHVEPQFIAQWRRYQRALNHRNASLKLGDAASLTRSWDNELVDAGTHVDRSRSSYVDQLNGFVNEATLALLGFKVGLTYQPGWRSESSLAAALGDAWPRDSRYKATTVGPHRAEMVVQIDGASSKDRISRGQQKLLACSLLLGQLQHRAALGMDPACLLLDDPAAELDVDNLSKLLSYLHTVPAQLVISTLSHEGLSGLSNARLFHVKQGVLAPVI